MKEEEVNLKEYCLKVNLVGYNKEDILEQLEAGDCDIGEEHLTLIEELDHE